MKRKFNHWFKRFLFPTSIRSSCIFSGRNQLSKIYSPRKVASKSCIPAVLKNIQITRDDVIWNRFPPILEYFLSTFSRFVMFAAGLLLVRTTVEYRSTDPRYFPLFHLVPKAMVPLADCCYLFQMGVYSVRAKTTLVSCPTVSSVLIVTTIVCSFCSRLEVLKAYTSFPAFFCLYKCRDLLDS